MQRHQKDTGFSISKAKQANARFRRKQAVQDEKETKGILLINALLETGYKQLPPSREGWLEEATLLMNEAIRYMKHRKGLSPEARKKLLPLQWNADWKTAGLDIKVVKEVPQQSAMRNPLGRSDSPVPPAKHVGSALNQSSTVPIAKAISLQELARAAMAKRQSTRSRSQKSQDGGKSNHQS